MVFEVGAGRGMWPWLLLSKAHVIPPLFGPLFGFGSSNDTVNAAHAQLMGYSKNPDPEGPSTQFKKQCNHGAWRQTLKNIGCLNPRGEVLVTGF